ncbi:unnamed protein product, partial [Discosporangium mesarthrocarpum]
MVVKALNVAEKPSVARELANILGGGRARRRQGRSQYNQIFEFECNMMRQTVSMKLTSVTGHLMETEFAEPIGKRWNACKPVDLFDAPIVKYVKEDNRELEKQLENEARGCQWLVLWLDCDREGENIAYEVIEVCTRRNQGLRIYRARFSALIPREILSSVQALVPPNEHQAKAVDARQEIDLRLGSAFTRFQTMRLQARFDELQEGVISYGPCQFPTMGFVVERYKRIQAFVPENFWSIKMEYSEEDPSAPRGQARADFVWKRGRLFDHACCLVLFELTVEDGVAVVTSVDARRVTKPRPIPLSTVELQKRASRFCHISSERTMTTAEALYQRGLLSYPRTETEKFKREFDIGALLEDFRNNPRYGNYVGGLVNDGGFLWPRDGRGDDGAHPPIHPTKSADPSTLQGDEQKIYDLVTKHFLACCSKDAVGHQTKVHACCGGEEFTATGLMVTERNWLDVYEPYERWTGRNIPSFFQGQEFVPSVLEMHEGRTEPPQLLSEADLINLMDEKGVGTDATIAEHILKIQQRKYCIKNEQNRFYPSTLGLALVDGYDNIGFQMSAPHLRAAMELDCTRISRGEDTKEAVVARCITTMKECFVTCTENAHKLDEAVAQHFQPLGTGGNTRSVRGGRNFSVCGQCGQPMDMKKSQADRPLLYCSSCSLGLSLPHKGKLVKMEPPVVCPLCNYEVISVTAGNNYSGNGYNVCPWCYNNPPEEHGGGEGMTFVCFKCTANCPLARGIQGGETAVAPCSVPCCGKVLTLKKSSKAHFYLGCKGYPQGCTASTVWLPRSAVAVTITEEHCPRCSGMAEDKRVLKLKFQFQRNKVPPGTPTSLVACPLCDELLKELGG